MPPRFLPIFNFAGSTTCSALPPRGAHGPQVVRGRCPGRFTFSSGINRDPVSCVLHRFPSSSSFRHRACSFTMARFPMRVTRSSSSLAWPSGAATRRVPLDWGVVRGRRSQQVVVSPSSEGSPPPVRHGRGRPRGRGRGCGRSGWSEAPRADAQPLPPPPPLTSVHQGPYADLHGFEFAF